jgi:3-deoxy-D-manno-octulosonate 8-phosphate phosphatase (KDO 8-P phosphatase)
MTNLIQQYELQGGVFITPPSVLTEKLKHIKALVFDWDGVFNNGRKTATIGSGFSEVDAMAINMLRFSMWLSTCQKQRVKAFVVTGENNETAFSFAKREAFDAVYYQVKDKTKALQHIVQEHGVQPHEMAFFFDDVLDLSVAKQVGARFLMGRTNGIAFNDFVKRKALADYITSNDGNAYSIREACELWMLLNNNLDEVFEKRMQFEGDYARFISERNAIAMSKYVFQNNELVQQV